jgi:hypothetical protein
MTIDARRVKRPDDLRLQCIHNGQVRLVVRQHQCLSDATCLNDQEVWQVSRGTDGYSSSGPIRRDDEERSGPVDARTHRPAASCAESLGRWPGCRPPAAPAPRRRRRVIIVTRRAAILDSPLRHGQLLPMVVPSLTMLAGVLPEMHDFLRSVRSYRHCHSSLPPSRGVRHIAGNRGVDECHLATIVGNGAGGR